LESGWNPPTSQNDDADEESAVLQSQLRQIYNEVKNHPSSWPFRKPVDKEEVPDYYDVIRFPMDLQTMGQRLKSGYYVSRKLFIADMTRMLNNCKVYNDMDTDYYTCATDMETFFASKVCQ
jgi:histone acetyltransferase